MQTVDADGEIAEANIWDDVAHKYAEFDDDFVGFYGRDTSFLVNVFNFIKTFESNRHRKRLWFDHSQIVSPLFGSN